MCMVVKNIIIKLLYIFQIYISLIINLIPTYKKNNQTTVWNFWTFLVQCHRPDICEIKSVIPAMCLELHLTNLAKQIISFEIEFTLATAEKIVLDRLLCDDDIVCNNRAQHNTMAAERCFWRLSWFSVLLRTSEIHNWLEFVCVLL